ncbi:MAG: hemolysin family protein [bacterium]|nr:hemolysin family protein [bacterium]
MSRQVLIIIYSILLVILLFLSIIFSSSDMAYGSASLTRLESIYRKDEKNKSNYYAYKLSKNYDSTISTILLLNDTVNAGLDSISTLLGVNIAFLILGETYPGIETLSENFGFIASMICLVTKITFGEIIAKSIGKIYNLKLCKIYGKLLNLLNLIFKPITFLVSGFGNIVSYPFVKNFNDIYIRDEELHEMVDEIEDKGLVDEDKAEILHGTIDYAETKAYEIMTPRVDVYAIDVADDLDEILNKEETYYYSRIPVFEDSIDNIIGYVLTKTLVRAKLENDNVSLKDILIKPLSFPRSTEINDILIEFKNTHQHFAVILDEYGGTEGVLTMEDILEEIVGEIYDESDNDTKPCVKNKDGSYIVDGQMNLEDFCTLFDIDYDKLETEYVTIGGYCIELLDDNFAKLHQKIQFENLSMTVIALDEKNTIEKLKVVVEEPKE